MRKLFAYLGADMALYVSPWKLNPVGARVAGDTPLPRSVGKMEEPVKALSELQEYLDRHAHDEH
jgi:hypothetical protein